MRRPSSSISGRSRHRRCWKDGAISSWSCGRATQRWMPNMPPVARTVRRSVRSEWAMPRPAVIQVHGAGPDRDARSPRLSRWMMSPVEQVGDGGEADVRMRAHVDALAGHELGRAHWSKKMNGPTIKPVAIEPLPVVVAEAGVDREVMGAHEGADRIELEEPHPVDHGAGARPGRAALASGARRILARRARYGELRRG